MRLRTTAGWLVAAVGLVFLMTGSAQANNIAVTNVALPNQDVVAKTVNVAFDLAWDNSWRGSENWDAAWVFVKFRAPGSNNWQHATLSTNSVDHKPAANSTIAAVSDGAGVFVYRSSGYTGSVNYAQIKLLWNYGTNGYSFAKGALVEVSVHAIEMVYVPAGPFYLGSGGSETISHFYRFTDGTQSTNPYLVAAESAITVGIVDGYLYYTAPGGNDCDGGSPIPDAFPKGYTAFYCMKYEISQGQYADFLNKLTGTQWTNRNTGANYASYRHTIHGGCTNSIADVPDRACNFLAWAHLLAYADWAALRPMTELECEKACRGPAYPVPDEYAWGSASYTAIASETGSGGTVTSGTPGANINFGGISGPTRVGIFATNNATRVLAGAGYYGVMDLSGNIFESAIGVGTVAGRAFTGACGDGILDASGNFNTANWPATVSEYRGGQYINGVVNYQKVSARVPTGSSWADHNDSYGGRAVRQAP